MILFFKPYFSSRPWHGDKLSKIYDCPLDTGEAWIISGYHNKSSIILNGKYQGMSLEEFFNIHKDDLFDMKEAKEFPLLLKIIDAKEDLSIQVHPDNEYALKKHNGNGKFESWYFLPGSTSKEVIVGTKVSSKEELKNYINNNQIMDVINSLPINEGSYLSIKPGTIHALKGGSLVLETQQPSDITYRLFDYNRFPRRELHIEDALNVIDYNLSAEVKDFNNDSYDENQYFSFDKFKVNGEKIIKSAKRFNIIYIIEGQGKINHQNVNQYDDLIVFTKDENLLFEGKMTLALINTKTHSKKI
jgi:mannose-6-phosphate isomerase